MPSFIIPIKPFWAMHLFDYELGNQHLFGGDPHLVLNVENVYYRSSFPYILEAPARILWYISEGKAKYPGSKAIRACSYLDEILVDKPKILFSKFQHLGVYHWDDIYKVAKFDVNNEIMAFKFSKTELFEIQGKGI